MQDSSFLRHLTLFFNQPRFIITDCHGNKVPAKVLVFIYDLEAIQFLFGRILKEKVSENEEKS